MKKSLTIKDIAKKIIKAKKTSKDTLSLTLDLEVDDYLRELVLNKQDDETYIKKLTPIERERCKVIYDKERKILVDGFGNPVSTINNRTKIYNNSSSFVYSLADEMYLFEHRETKENEFLVHGSILDDRPVKMAGIIAIYQGKIAFISNNSGHYTPNYIDLYFFIKDLHKKMPGLLSKQTKIEFPPGSKSNIEFFLQSVRSTYDTRLDRERALFNINEQRVSEIKRLKSISFYSFISNNRPLEAAELLLNSSDRVEINILDEKQVELVHKLISALTPFPEIKENILCLLDNKEYSFFREFDLINQRHKLQKLTSHLSGDEIRTDSESEMTDSPSSLRDGRKKEESQECISGSDTFETKTADTEDHVVFLTKKPNRKVERSLKKLDDVEKIKSDHQIFLSEESKENGSNQSEKTHLTETYKAKRQKFYY